MGQDFRLLPSNLHRILCYNTDGTFKNAVHMHLTCLGQIKNKNEKTGRKERWVDREDEGVLQDGMLG